MTTNEPISILIVEDEEDLAALYAEWLTADRFDVIVATSGIEALAALDEQIDIVLLDRRIPNVSGDEILRAIRKRISSCRVAMVTAVEPDFDILEMGFDDYLVKPVDKHALRDTVNRLRERMAYDTELNRYVSLATKKATLETEKQDEELYANPHFQDLEMELSELRESIDTMVDNFDTEDVAAVLRDPNQTPDVAWSN